MTKNNKNNDTMNTYYNTGNPDEDRELLEYLQQKLHEIEIEFINYYNYLKEDGSIPHFVLATIFGNFRKRIKNISGASRSKSTESSSNNNRKELKILLENLIRNNNFNTFQNTNITKEFIDSKINEFKTNFFKDFFAATLVFYDDNQKWIDRYVNLSDNEEIQKYYKQYSDVKKYLNLAPTNKKNSSFDITSTYVNTPVDIPELEPLNIENIQSMQDYYNERIKLLTLSRNMSARSTSANEDGKFDYIISQKDINILDILEIIDLENDKKELTPEQEMDLIIKLSEKYRNNYIPFDKQLENAINKRESASTEPLSEKEKRKRIIALNYLKNNLISISGDNLQNAIMNLEIPNIIKHLSGLPGLDIKILSEKDIAKSNSFRAHFYTILINNEIPIELQTMSEIRRLLSQEGPAAHNAAYKSAVDTKSLFELNQDTNSSTDNKKLLNLYCDFLNIININDLSNDSILEKNKEKYFNRLIYLVDYAFSKIKIKDTITNEDNETYSFSQYITNLVTRSGADFFTLSPAHRLESNQLLDTPQDKLYSLETLFKNRFGLSALAQKIVQACYNFIDSSKEAPTLYYPSLVAQNAENLSNEYTKFYKSKKTQKFVPQGGKHSHDER